MYLVNKILQGSTQRVLLDYGEFIRQAAHSLGVSLIGGYPLVIFMRETWSVKRVAFNLDAILGSR